MRLSSPDHIPTASLHNVIGVPGSYKGSLPRAAAEYENEIGVKAVRVALVQSTLGWQKSGQTRPTIEQIVNHNARFYRS